jgi:hypothetical protein
MAHHKRITVIDTTVIRSGTSSSGKDWTLYEVTAVDENGAPIEEKLKSFDALSGTVEVEVEKDDNPKYGVSYMLKLPKGSAGASAPPAGARLGPKVDDLRGRVEHLEDQVSGLTRAVEELRGGTPVPQPTPVPTETRFGGDDDVPF